MFYSELRRLLSENANVLTDSLKSDETPIVFYDTNMQWQV